MKNPEHQLSAAAERLHKTKDAVMPHRPVGSNPNQLRPGESLARLAADRLRHFSNLR